MIKVLIVEDSTVMQELLTYILQLDPEFSIVGIANNGYQAIEMVEELKPDVITMDIHMPDMDGLTATRKIMATNPLPIVIITASQIFCDVQKSFNALDYGALSIIEKPQSPHHPDFENKAKKIRDTIKIISEIKLVKRWNINSKKLPVNSKSKSLEINKEREQQIVAIGASTGGPPVLRTIISALDKTFPLPVLIVQHISEGFLPGLVDWLAKTSKLKVKIAANNDDLEQGQIYFAPNGYHMCVNKSKKIILIKGKKDEILQPAISYLFQSIGDSFNEKAIGILLTGMGNDGARELKQLKDRGAVTIIQKKETCAVFGMPGVAYKLNGAKFIFTPYEIAVYLNNICHNELSSNGTL